MQGEVYATTPVPIFSLVDWDNLDNYTASALSGNWTSDLWVTVQTLIITELCGKLYRIYLKI